MCSTTHWIKIRKQYMLRVWVKALTIMPALFTERENFASQSLCIVDLCLWILTIHHWGMQSSVNVCRLPFFLNNPFRTSSHVQLKSKLCSVRLTCWCLGNLHVKWCLFGCTLKGKNEFSGEDYWGLCQFSVRLSLFAILSWFATVQRSTDVNWWGSNKQHTQ